MLSSSDLKVGVVDDSPLIRKMIAAVVDETPGMHVVGMAADPYQAREMIKAKNPDVITLDVEMPHMNGIEFLDKIMKLRPMPVIMVSTLTKKGADITLQALEMGAVDYVAKPDPASNRSDDILDAFRNMLIPKLETVKTLNFSGASRLGHAVSQNVAVTKTNSQFDLIAIASSTGGVERLRFLFSHIRANVPPIVIVQHINKLYVPNMVERMQSICPSHIKVLTPSNREALRANTIYFANNEQHLEVEKRGAGCYASLKTAPALNGFIASADYLFGSLAEDVAPKRRVLGMILSGMGNDGANGLLQLEQAGAQTIGESESSCLVYGMSKAAAKLGAVQKELSIQQICRIVNGKVV